MQPAYTHTQSPRWCLSQRALACEEHSLPSWTWVCRQQAGRKKKRLTSNVLVLLSSLNWSKAPRLTNVLKQSWLEQPCKQARWLKPFRCTIGSHTHFYVSLDPNGYKCDVTRTEEMHTCNAPSFFCFPENPLRRNPGFLGQGTLKRGGKVRKWGTTGVPFELRRRFVLPPGTGVHASMCAWVHQQATVTW